MIRSYEELAELGSLADEWDRLALQAGTPFMTHEWLSAWCNAFGGGRCSWTVLHDDDGSIRACACVQRSRTGRLASTTNVHSSDWEVLARDEQARSELLHALVHEGANRIQLEGMLEDTEGARFVSGELERSGYKAVRIPGPFCPWLTFPSSWEELLAS